MSRIRLIAKADFIDFGGHARTAGEYFEAAPIEAAALTYRHQAIFADKAQAGETEPPRRRRVTRKRAYRRRDLVAES